MYVNFMSNIPKTVSQQNQKWNPKWSYSNQLSRGSYNQNSNESCCGMDHQVTESKIHDRRYQELLS